MSKNLLLCGLVAGIGLLGCAAPLNTRAGGCAHDACDVEVTVTDCKVSLSPQDLMVPTPRGRKKITWKLQSDDYIFAADGIDITDPDHEFDHKYLHASGKKFMWDDKHTKQGQYEYAVNVIRTGDDPKACLKYDPTISNQ